MLIFFFVYCIVLQDGNITGGYRSREMKGVWTAMYGGPESSMCCNLTKHIQTDKTQSNEENYFTSLITQQQQKTRKHNQILTVLQKEKNTTKYRNLLKEAKTQSNAKHAANSTDNIGSVVNASKYTFLYLHVCHFECSPENISDSCVYKLQCF